MVLHSTAVSAKPGSPQSSLPVEDWALNTEVDKNNDSSAVLVLKNSCLPNSLMSEPLKKWNNLDTS